ncbi:PP-loop family protein [Thecamonas trahens ATCC 50062]|uniref:PP-loop family protein n=1 Tax=Thecamonas trahens ATCC 50062 TaxID=461836 RepID=A0A0L0D4Y6_THETB|nr:PP-loop family protein [Thecamonas trahens ATCC 50062]KNC47121.1 PP-loop family protein [Thecamonas trahens ATCC 50062]|eukprot:XP_013759897.1 PP-loop family protein [Thecamonas trahens ATCC 50062]
MTVRIAAGVFAERMAGLLAAVRREGGRLRVAVAVSGGADSLAAAALVDEWIAAGAAAEASVVTVDHRLRAEAAEEAAWVASLPGSPLLPAMAPGAGTVLRVDEPPSSQEHGRMLRYAAMARYAARSGIDVIITGHSADDVAESTLLRAGQASGVDGLAAMAAMAVLRPPPTLLAERNVRTSEHLSADGPPWLSRPLTRHTRAQLEATCEAFGLAPGGWVADPSNEMTKYARTRARLALRLPAAAVVDASGSLAQTALVLRDMRDAAEAQLASWRAAHVAVRLDGSLCVADEALDALPQVLRLRAVSMLITAVAQRTYPPRRRGVEAVLALVPGASQTVAGVLAVRRSGRLEFKAQP